MVEIVLALLVVGVALYLIGLIPMDPVVLNIIRVVVILAVILWLFGYGPGFPIRFRR